MPLPWENTDKYRDEMGNHPSTGGEARADGRAENGLATRARETALRPPRQGVERRERRPVDGGLRVPRHRGLAPAAVGDAVDAAARDAVGVGRIRDLELK